MWCFSGALANTDKRGNTISFSLLARILLIHSRILLALFEARVHCWLMFSLVSTKVWTPFSSELGWVSHKNSGCFGLTGVTIPNLEETLQDVGQEYLELHKCYGGMLLWKWVTLIQKNILGKAWRWEEWNGSVLIGEKAVLEERSNCRFIGNFRLEMTPGGPQCNCLLKAASLRRPHHVAQGFSKRGVENPQRGRLHSLWTSCATLGRPHGKFFISSLKLCCFNICLLSLMLRVWPCLSNMQGYR